MQTKKDLKPHVILRFYFTENDPSYLFIISLGWEYGLEAALQNPTLKPLEFRNLGL